MQQTKLKREKIQDYLFDVIKNDNFNTYTFKHANSNLTKIVKANSKKEAVNKIKNEIEENGTEKFFKPWK